LSRRSDPPDGPDCPRPLRQRFGRGRSRRVMSEPIHLTAFEQIASAALPPMVYDYYAGGAHDEISLRDNVEAYRRIRLRYRVLRDVAERSLETEVLGERVSMPVLIAPTAFHQLATEEGEVA